MPGHNFRLTNFQSSLGNSQIKRLNLIKKKRTELYTLYKKFIENQNIDVQVLRHGVIILRSVTTSELPDN